MSDVAAFSLELAALLSALVVVSAWLFRTSAAPLALKLALPSAMLALALWLSYDFVALLGRPITTTFARMPDPIRLIAFKALDDDARVDLWIDEGGATRAYEIPLDGRTKQALKQARGELADGRPVALSKRKSGAAASMTELLGGPQAGFELVPFHSSLPPKD
jgi:hypothetical protein